MRTKQEFGLFLKANEKLLKDFKERGTRFAFSNNCSALARGCFVSLHHLT